MFFEGGEMILVAYFSASGVTGSVARKISDETKADLFEIVPVVPYSNMDLDWTDKKSRSTIEMKDENARPEFIKWDLDLSKYDTVFIGFPNWWGVEPRIIDTFLETYDFKGKTIVPFFTSGGSGKGKIKERLERIVSADVKEPCRLRASSDIKEYVKELKL